MSSFFPQFNSYCGLVPSTLSRYDPFHVRRTSAKDNAAFAGKPLILETRQQQKWYNHTLAVSVSREQLRSDLDIKQANNLRTVARKGVMVTAKDEGSGRELKEYNGEPK